MSDHCKDPIFKHKEVLSPNYLPECLPNRMNEIKTIREKANQKDAVQKGHSIR